MHVCAYVYICVHAHVVHMCAHVVHMCACTRCAYVVYVCICGLFVHICAYCGCVCGKWAALKCFTKRAYQKVLYHASSSKAPQQLLQWASCPKVASVTEQPQSCFSKRAAQKLLASKRELPKSCFGDQAAAKVSLVSEAQQVLQWASCPKVASVITLSKLV